MQQNEEIPLQALLFQDKDVLIIIPHLRLAEAGVLELFQDLVVEVQVLLHEDRVHPDLVVDDVKF